ncbi:MAG: cyclic nucleotide-binding/CBS domain-containing protein, partial [Alcanivoracaceae bacterium]|nr:cyclic nucleotide-binding/CBS domain-containing protein [Alcanivoracaceae bacterium]
SDSQLKEVVLSIEISYSPRGSEVLGPKAQNHWLYLIRSGAVERTDDEHGLVARFVEKDFFGHRSLERGGGVEKNVKAIEDSLFYLIPSEIYFQLMQEHSGFKCYFHQTKNKRLRSAINEINTQEKNLLHSSRVKELLHQQVLSISPSITIRETAKLMSMKKMTAALVVEDNEIKGIVTDRVFCTKVVAQAHDLQATIATIMTKKLITISPQETGLEAMLIMARHNIRHLPVIENSKVLGLLTATDLIHHQSHNPIYVVNEIHKATTIKQLKNISLQLPMALCKLVDAGLKAHDITYSISSVGRAIAQKLIKMGVKQLGEPPVAFAYIIAGSLARNDQSVHSDQDNGMILADDYDEKKHGDYFFKLATFVSDGLDACGYIYCPGDVMATNDKWRVSYSVWRSYFKKWIHTPEPKALMYSSIFFDLRCIYGDQGLLQKLQVDISAMIEGNKIFLAFMAANATQTNPPLGLFRRFVLEKHGAEKKSLDMKKRGIMPTTDIARVFALDAGIAQINTRERFRLAYENKIISKEAYRDLTDAYDFLCIVRLRHQVIKIKKQQQADNYVEPNELSSLERRHLKDAFEIIRTYQDVLSNRYNQGRM